MTGKVLECKKKKNLCSRVTMGLKWLDGQTRRALVEAQVLPLIYRTRGIGQYDYLIEDFVTGSRQANSLCLVGCHRYSQLMQQIRKPPKS